MSTRLSISQVTATTNRHTTHSTATPSNRVNIALPANTSPRRQFSSEEANHGRTSDLSGSQSITLATRPETSTTQLSSHEFEIAFNRAYHDFYNFNKISRQSEEVMASQDVDL